MRVCARVECRQKFFFFSPLSCDSLEGRRVQTWVFLRADAPLGIMQGVQRRDHYHGAYCADKS